MAKAAAKKAPTKSEIYANIAETTGLSKKDVAAVFDALADEVKRNIGNRGPGAFTVPGLLKITKKKVPARPAQKNVRNPFTGELQDRPAKPAYNKVSLRALKALKEMV
jgi:nucleoid DNA-binding protein